MAIKGKGSGWDEITLTGTTGLTDVNSTEKMIELMDRAEAMIQQVNGLYGQFMSGVEERPPVERRSQLDQVMNTLMMMNKATQSLRFRYTSVSSAYTSYKNRWDKLLMDLEAGRIKRTNRGRPKGPGRP